MTMPLVDGCLICNGRGQVAAGTSCPVCEGTGVATAEQAASYRQLLVDAAVDAATERFRVAGTTAAEGILRGLAQARDDAKETTARAGEVLTALKYARQAAWVAQQAALRVMGAETLVTRAEAAASGVAARLAGPLPPDPTDPPPGITLPAGMGGEIYYFDSLLVRQMDVWGNLSVGGSGGLLSNPMTTLGDLIMGGAAGAAQRLGVGANAQVLTVVAGVPAWANSAAGFANPMTTSQDLIVGGVAGTAGRLGVGAPGQVLTVSAGLVGWANSPAGFANPMTTLGDLIVAGAGGTAGRLALGAPGQVLTVAGGTAAWQTNPAGFANPMTTSGDLIVATAGGAATRLPVGSNAQVLGVSGGVPAWIANAAALGTPLGGPSPSQQTMFRQPDGSILVLPLSTYGLAGDDSTWINNAIGLLPTIPGGSSAYGGTYNGPWIIGTIVLAPAIYTITAGIVMPTNSGATVNLIGHGPGAVLMVGTGAVGLTSHVAMGGPQGGPPARQTMGTYRGLRFDGTNGGLVGVEVGGGWGRHIDVACVNFNSSSAAIGFHILNAANVAAEWIEKCRISVDLMMNSTSCVIEQTANLASGGADSCEYNDIDLYIIASNSATANGPGLLLQGGAYLSGGSLKIRGNFATNSGPVVKITGSNPASGNNSTIYKQFVDITVESAATSNIPQTINFGAAGNSMRNNVGILSFKFVNFTPSNAAAGQFTIKGLVDGDQTLIDSNAGVTTPTVPLASTDVTNNTNTDVIAYITGGTGVAVVVDGVATGLGSGPFHLPNGGRINLGAYSAAPTWKWVGVI